MFVRGRHVRFAIQKRHTGRQIGNKMTTNTIFHLLYKNLLWRRLIGGFLNSIPSPLFPFLLVVYFGRCYNMMSLLLLWGFLKATYLPTIYKNVTWEGLPLAIHLPNTWPHSFWHMKTGSVCVVIWASVCLDLSMVFLIICFPQYCGWQSMGSLLCVAPVSSNA